MSAPGDGRLLGKSDRGLSIMSDEVSFVEVFVGNSIEASMVKAMLEYEGIDAFVQDELVGINFPHYSSPGGAGGVKVAVPENSAEQARQLIEASGKDQGG